LHEICTGQPKGGLPDPPLGQRQQNIGRQPQDAYAKADALDNVRTIIDAAMLKGTVTK
jgi:hypothetical protein